MTAPEAMLATNAIYDSYYTFVAAGAISDSIGRRDRYRKRLRVPTAKV